MTGTTAWDNRNSFGGTEALITTGFGLYADATTDLSIRLPVAAYSLDGMERAIARQTQPRRRRGPMSQFFNSDTLPTRTTAPTPDPPPFGSRVDDYFDNLGGSGPTMSMLDGSGDISDAILVGAGLTVY